MADLTAAQILDMQGDLAIGSDQSVFTDAELQQLFTRAGEDYGLAVYYAWRQILAGSAAWIDYRVAQTSVSRSQAFDHILKMVEFWQAESRGNANQIKILGANPVPTIHKPVPADEYPRSQWPYPWSRWRY